MQNLSLFSALALKTPAIVSFFGGGGKTTLGLKLASEMVAGGHKVLFSTTTKIFRPPAVALFCNQDPHRMVRPLIDHFRENNMAVLGKSILPDGKIEGLEPSDIDYLGKQLPASIIVEADGAKGRPLKGHAPYEPVLPASSDLIVAVVGSDALGAQLNPFYVHRLKHFLKATGTEEGGPVTEQVIAKAFKSMLRTGYAQAPAAATVLVLNKADLLDYAGPSSLAIARLMAGACEEGRVERLLVTAGREPDPVKITISLKPPAPAISVACIILSAGESSRMGREKLWLKIGAKTVLEHTTGRVAEAGFKDITVVTRPGRINSGLSKAQNIKLIENPHYRAGMSASLRAGLEAVDSTAQGALIVLADQPLVPSDVYRSLHHKYTSALPLAVYPVFKGCRGNPVLFDRRLWPELIRLSGDQGGRFVLEKLDKNQAHFIEADTPAVLLDIDSPEDYLFHLDYYAGPD